jgi:hypothetical protein
MYKITVHGKTMVGCNHDTWLLTPRIWFETGKGKGYLGAAFTGARSVGPESFAPQSGMNESGLAFSRLASATPQKGIKDLSDKKPISNPEFYLKDILHRCKTVEEVKAYIEQYDHSLFMEDVFVYIEKSGKYLVVEPYTLTIGNDIKYVQANFCPSQTPDLKSIKQPRYVNGTTFLKNKLDTSLSFCTALSDTMHVCRKKIGDGTLLTSIWDTNQGNTYLYFYHDYKHLVKFNLKEELAKGDHILDITTLFPPNEEFKKLAGFKTPLNSHVIELFLLFMAVFLFFSFTFFLISFIRNKHHSKFRYMKLVLSAMSFILLYYVYVLAREINIFYFPAPYKDYKFSLLNIAAYIPFLVLLSIIPLLVINWKLLKERSWSPFQKMLFILNNFSYITLIFLFTYWGLYDVFS